MTNAAEPNAPSENPLPLKPHPVSGADSLLSAGTVKGRPVASDLHIDIPDPASPQTRHTPRVDHPKDPAGLRELMSTTSARIGVGRLARVTAPMRYCSFRATTPSHKMRSTAKWTAACSKNSTCSACKETSAVANNNTY